MKSIAVQEIEKTVPKEYRPLAFHISKKIKAIRERKTKARDLAAKRNKPYQVNQYAQGQQNAYESTLRMMGMCQKQIDKITL